MTLKIVKPELVESDTPFDANAARTAIATGMVDDTVTDLYSAVKAASASNGGQVEGIYNDLLKELRNLILIANTAAASGATIDNIIIAINKEAVNFSPLDLKTMMVEVYGSIAEWKQAMIFDAE
jgi:DNA polymerase III gamma/tau subunit